MYHIPIVPQSPEKSTQFPIARVTGDYEPHWCMLGTKL